MDIKTIDAILTLVMYIFIAVVGTVGNLLVIIYFGWKKMWKNRRSRSTYHILIVQLAVADLICSMNAPLIAWSHSLQIFTKGWIFGTFICKYSIIGWLLTATSAWILCGMTFERYRSIVYPLKKRITVKMLACYSMLCWTFSVLLFLPLAMAVEVRDMKCAYNKEHSYYKSLQYYIPFEVVMRLIIPVFLMYYWTHKTMHALNVNSSAIGSAYADERSKQKQIQREKAVIRVLWSIVIAYTICVVPANVLYVVGVLVDRLGSQNLRGTVENYIPYLNTWAKVLVYSNSIMNCFVYAGKFKDFRKFCSSVICKIKC